MAVGAFPIAKLGALAIKQLSKPLARHIKERAKSSPFFRRYVCMPPAQIYHWCEVNIKMRLLNLGKPSAVKPLQEREAIELGAELLGEFTIFTVAAGTILAEYMRQSRNEKAKEDMKEDRYHRLTHELEELQLVLSRQEAEIQHLNRMIGARPHQIVPRIELNPAAKREGSTYVSLDQAVEDAKQAMGKKKTTAQQPSANNATSAATATPKNSPQPDNNC